MPETPFFSLSTKDRQDALGVAASLSGRPTYLIEKDIWVVQTLSTLFEASFGGDLTFKGGTSLSKAYQAIDRFSEDIDITYNIRALMPDLVPNDAAPLPGSRNQADKWRERIDKALESWISSVAQTAVSDGLHKAGVTPLLKVTKDCIYVVYEPLLPSSSHFVASQVKVDFGARSTGEPHKNFQISCEAASWVEDVVFPMAHAQVLSAERTFWEKATAVHVFCRKKQLRKGEDSRESRHWYDLVRLDDKGYADKALADHNTAIDVAIHKHWFFRANDSAGERIKYKEAVSGDLQLLPDCELGAALKDDYTRMQESGMLLPSSEPFEDLMQRCEDLQNRANNGSRSAAVKCLLENL